MSVSSQVPATPTRSAYATTPSASSPHYSTTRRHSLYGTEDRIIIDPGSRVWKVGFSGEGKPRDVFLACERWGGSSLWKLVGMPGSEGEREEERRLLEYRLQDRLRHVFLDSLLTDPKSRKVIVIEHPLLPLHVKDLIARILFRNLQVPSISFAPSHLLSLMAVGRMTGVVIDIGHLESVVLPIYASRPLFPQLRTTPLAGSRLTSHLRSLILTFGTYVPPPSNVNNPNPVSARVTRVPEEILTERVLEDIKTRCCFVSDPPTSRPGSVAQNDPFAMDIDSTSESGSSSAHRRAQLSVDSDVSTSSSRSHSRSGSPTPSMSTTRSESTLNLDQIPAHLKAASTLYMQSSSATDLRIRVPVPGNVTIGDTLTLSKGTLVVPGWVRERAAEMLFEQGDVDESSIAEIILDSLLKTPVDLRKDLALSILVVGGTAMLPGLIPRLHGELLRLLTAPPTTSEEPPSTPPSSHRPQSPTTPTAKDYQRSSISNTQSKRKQILRRRTATLEDRYSSLRPLAPYIAILNNPSSTGPIAASSAATLSAGRAPAFTPSTLPWIGGSLAGALKTGGEEMTRERYDEALEESVNNSVEMMETPLPSETRSEVPVTPVKTGWRNEYFLPDWTRSPLPAGAPSVFAATAS